MKEQNQETGLIFRNAGDRGFIVEFGQKIDPDINKKVRAMTDVLNKNTPVGITEIIPTYRSVLLVYDPVLTTPAKFTDVIKNMAVNFTNLEIESGSEIRSGSKIEHGTVVEIPVCYGGDFGPDIKNVEKASGLDREEVIKLHSAPEYLIYMVGFTPGFPFLGGLNEKLFTPRLETPRMAVPKGSVGIANDQTGMYPIQSPGGWQIIGRTSLNLFDPYRKNPFLYKAGDKIRFIPVSKEKFLQLQKKREA
jgi:inhibitor of KinA